MSAETPRTPPPSSRRSRALGGLRSAANLSPEERSERARKAAIAGWAKRNAERAAQGLPPTKKRAPEPSADELEPWLELVDRRYPDREWPNREARRRQAIILARTAAAEAASDALKRRGDA
ncbi:hypothetical protein LG322_08735 [Microbacterium aerolatum]|uniref:hypothetical protein n=1 Tax=Microbacterium aerolatum TaxID=153731 RepID=UPI00384B33E2